MIHHVKDKTEADKTVWKATTQWLGGFKSQAQIRDFTIGMDEPTALGGANTAPNMVEMILGAYGYCLTTGYAANAALWGIELEDIQIELEGDLNGFFGLQDPEQCWPGYTSVRAKVTLKAPHATAEQIQTLHEAVVKTSPVGSILTRPIQVARNWLKPRHRAKGNFFHSTRNYRMGLNGQGEGPIVTTCSEIAEMRRSGGRSSRLNTSMIAID